MINLEFLINKRKYNRLSRTLRHRGLDNGDTRSTLSDNGIPVYAPTYRESENRVLRNYMANGTLKIDPGCYDLVDSLESLVSNPLRIEDCKKGDNDHGADALRAVVTYAHMYGETPLTPEEQAEAQYNYDFYNDPLVREVLGLPQWL